MHGVDGREQAGFKDTQEEPCSQEATVALHKALRYRGDAEHKDTEAEEAMGLEFLEEGI